MKLKNGASIISKTKCKDVGYIILAQKRKSDGTMEYITWLTDDDLNCFHGNYYSHLENATRNYKKRVIQYA